MTPLDALESQSIYILREAYARVDWSRFEKLPAFKAANRINAYNTFILMEKEALAGK